LSAFIKGKTLVVPAGETEQGDRYSSTGGPHRRTLDGDLFRRETSGQGDGDETAAAAACGSRHPSPRRPRQGRMCRGPGNTGGDLIGMDRTSRSSRVGRM
jgi:hypothetical protein